MVKISSVHMNKVHFGPIFARKNFLVIPINSIEPYNIFPKNYNFLEKYIWLCYTTSIERFGEKHETRDLIRTD